MKIKIGHRTYKLEFIDNIRDDGKNGICFVDKGIIHVSKDIPDEVQKVTVFHEVMHAAWSYVGLPEDQEETIIGMLDDALYAALKENPKLVEYLFTAPRTV